MRQGRFRRGTADGGHHGPDSAWAGAFAAERARLAGVFGPAALVIEHIGSTAVPGLPAKPTIDIAADFYRDRRGYVAAKTGIITELLAEAGSPA